VPVRTALDLRLKRAQTLVGHVSPNGLPNHYYVASQTNPAVVYDVTIVVDQTKEPGHIIETHCTCPDWQRQFLALQEYPLNPGISQIHGWPACKHVLAVVLAEKILEEVAK